LFYKLKLSSIFFLKKKFLELCPALESYCNGEYFDIMEEAEWSIRLKFDDVKAMFDPVVEKILRLINNQLKLCEDCSALILVGGFSESKYLQSRIKKEFSEKVPVISIPPQPVIAVMKGGKNLKKYIKILPSFYILNVKSTSI
jgi:hypothetical protein